MFNLDDHLERRKAIMLLDKQLDEFCIAEFAEDPRTHLGASIIGHDCKAYAWNTFRWLHQEPFIGRMLRLFNRGHEEEHRFVRWLKGIGFDVHEVDDNTGKQYRITGSRGHFGGSLDAILHREDTGWLLGEFKTHNAKSFAKLQKEKLLKAKPIHYKQMCSYGKAYGLKFGLYCSVNKDTDELYFEIVPLDWKQADELYIKADNIIFSQAQPMKIAQTDTFFECKYCHFSGICHHKQEPEKNCRSCVHAYPVDNAEWFCQHHNAIIPADFIPKGCNEWVRII